MSEPQTEAGKRLLRQSGRIASREALHQFILAIEAEALTHAEQRTRDLEAALESQIEMFEGYGSMTGHTAAWLLRNVLAAWREARAAIEGDTDAD